MLVQSQFGSDWWDFGPTRTSDLLPDFKWPDKWSALHWFFSHLVQGLVTESLTLFLWPVPSKSMSTLHPFDFCSHDSTCHGLGVSQRRPPKKGCFQALLFTWGPRSLVWVLLHLPREMGHTVTAASAYVNGVISQMTRSKYVHLHDDTKWYQAISVGNDDQWLEGKLIHFGCTTKASFKPIGVGPITADLLDLGKTK